MNPFDICLAKQLVGESGGGNPNRVQTITGTLDDPWGDVDYAELLAAVYIGDATAIMTFDGTALGFGEYTNWLNIETAESGGSTIPFEFWMAAADITGSVTDALVYSVVWGWQGPLLSSSILQNGTITEIQDYASLVPTELTIIWHPLPE